MGTGSENPRMGEEDDKAIAVKVTKDNGGGDEKHAMLYDEPGCFGNTRLIVATKVPDSDVYSSDMRYAKEHTWSIGYTNKWPAAHAKSVKLNADLELTYFNKHNFKGDGISHKNFSQSNPKCMEINQEYETYHGEDSLLLKSVTFPQ